MLETKNLRLAPGRHYPAWIAAIAIIVTVLGAPAACANPLGIPDAEYDALVALYDSANGSDWTNSANWLTSATPWYGVTVSDGHVIMLDLYGNRLTGSIPPELGALGNLQYLWLDKNSLTGSMPPELGELASLQYMWLDGNQLTGSIPSELGALTNLRSLRLDYNQLTGSIPSELGALTNLRSLYLHNNELDGPIPPELGNLAELRYLFLNSNRLTGEIPDSIVNLTQLAASNCDLGYNALFSSDPEVTAFLETVAPGWLDTQTVAPSDVLAVVGEEDQVTVSWTPIIYTADPGFYEVGTSDSPGGPYTFLPQNRTVDKSASSLSLVDLPAGHSCLVVRAVTQPHANNPRNTVTSLPSQEVVVRAPVMPKLLADGTAALASGVVTAVFPEFFYVESADRAWGIRVLTTGEVPRAVRVNVLGTLGTGANGERYMEPSSVAALGPGSAAPLAMAGRSLGGGDWMYDGATGAGQRGVKDGVGPNTTGLLVVIWGRVTASGEGWFYVDDGSEVRGGTGSVGIRVNVNAAGLTAPPEGSFVSVTGISSCEYQDTDLVNVVLPESQSDIAVLEP